MTSRPIPLLLTLALLGACTNGGPKVVDLPSDSFLDPSAVRWKEAPPAASAVLTAVRAAEHPGFDRVVFEFQDRVPSWKTSYVPGPAQDCGSGETQAVAGGALLEVTFQQAQAHTDEGQATIPERERALNYPALQELQRTCDFEGMVTYFLGTKDRARYRIEELSAPPRLVVDVEH